MKTQVYLMCQLPSLDGVGDKSLPITYGYFIDLASRFLVGKELEVLEALSLEAPRDGERTGFKFLDAWYKNERDLRYALAQVRAQKLGREAVVAGLSLGADVVNCARCAIGMDNPYAQEEYLYSYRMGYLSSIQPLNDYCIDSVFAYGIKLLLISRRREFDKESGAATYHKIYDAVLGSSK